MGIFCQDNARLVKGYAYHAVIFTMIEQQGVVSHHPQPASQLADIEVNYKFQSFYGIHITVLYRSEFPSSLACYCRQVILDLDLHTFISNSGGCAQASGNIFHLCAYFILQFRAHVHGDYMRQIAFDFAKGIHLLLE